VRFPNPWTRDRRNRRYWYVTLGGEQILLGSCEIGNPTFIEVVQKVKEEYGKLIAGHDSNARRQSAKVRGEYFLTIKALAASFFEWTENNLSQNSIEPYRLYVRKVVRSLPDQTWGSPIIRS